MTEDIVELQKLKLFKVTAERFITAALRIEPVPWLACAGPSTWQALAGKERQLYLWELDPRQVRASQLLSNEAKLTHDIEVALAPYMDVRVSIKNSVGLGLVFDQSPIEKVDLLTQLDQVERCLVVGHSDAGKTTLFKHVAARRLAQGSEVIVLDPHSHQSRWPAGTKVVGTGEDYGAIEAALSQIRTLKKDRYAQIGAGQVEEGSHPRTTVIIDEYYELSLELKDVTATVLRLLTGGRKVNLDIFVGTHSDDVITMGMAGQGRLRRGFVKVEIEKMAEGLHRAALDRGRGREPAELPGPYSRPPALSEGREAQAAQISPPPGGTGSADSVPTLAEASGPPAADGRSEAPRPQLTDYASKSGEWCITVSDQKNLVLIGHHLLGGHLPVTATSVEAGKRKRTRHLKHHMLKELFAYWEAMGWLKPAPAANKGRVITPELLKLARVKPRQPASAVRPVNVTFGQIKRYFWAYEQM